MVDSSSLNLRDLPLGVPARVLEVSGERGFRRRLLELGLLPGTELRALRVAPLGDPIELLLRGGCLSIRRQEASQITVTRIEK